MQLAKAGKYNGYLLEGMACPGGCVAGAGTMQAIKKSQAAVNMYAQEHNLSLMVMGTHGGSSLRIMMLGSVTMSVASQTKLPMLLVHHDDPTLLRDLSKEE